PAHPPGNNAQFANGNHVFCLRTASLFPSAKVIRVLIRQWAGVEGQYTTENLLREDASFFLWKVIKGLQQVLGLAGHIATGVGRDRTQEPSSMQEKCLL